MLKKIWRYLTTYGIRREALADIMPDVVDGNLRGAVFFLLCCVGFLLMGTLSPLLVEKNTEKALIFLGMAVPYLLMLLAAVRLRRSPEVPPAQTETFIVLVMMTVAAVQIYIGALSNPGRPAVLYHAILLCTMAMFVTRPAVSIALPLLATMGLFFADRAVKTEELLFQDMINGAFSTSLAIGAGLFFSRRAVSGYLLKNKSREQLAQLEQKSRLTLEALHFMEQGGEELAIAQHDELHHLRTLSALCREAPEKAADYADSLISELEAVTPMRFTENITINAILTVQASKARKAGVQFRAEAIVPRSLPIADKDLCTVLMNLLENAVEAAAKTLPEEERRVQARLYVEDGCLLAVIENSLPDGFEMEAFRARAGRSTKSDGHAHGIGMRSAAAVLSHYDGELRYTCDGGMLTLHTGMWMGA